MRNAVSTKSEGLSRSFMVWVALSQNDNLVSGRALKPYEFYSDKKTVGRLKSFYFVILFLSLCGFQSAFATGSTTTSFRYEGRLQGPGLTGVIPNQTFSASIKRPDNCGGNLGLAAWTSSTVTLDEGTFSISPTFQAADLATAMNPWNDFGSGCPVSFERQLVITWGAETFTINMEDSARANLASYAINANNSAKIGNFPVQQNLVCSAGNVLKYNPTSSQLECLALATTDIPNLSATQIPALAGDVSGSVTSTSVDKIKGINVATTPPTNGQVLKFNGANWSPAADDTGGAPSDSSYAVKGLVQINTDLATSGLFISSGVLAMPNVIAAGTTTSAGDVPVITYDQKGRINSVTTVTPNDTTKLPLAGGTMTGDLNMGNRVLHTANKIGVGTNSPVNLIQANGNDVSSLIEVINESSTVFRQTGFVARNYAGSTGAPTQFIGKTSRGSFGTPTASLNGDHIMDIMAAAGNGVGGFSPVSMISLVAEENISSSSSAGSILLATTAVGTTMPQERVRINPSGRVGIGTTTPNAALDVNGGIRFGDDLVPCNAAKTGAIRYNSGNMQLCDGSAWKVINSTGSGVATIAQGGTNNSTFNMDQMVYYNSGTGRIESFPCGLGQTLSFGPAGQIGCENPNTALGLARYDAAGKLITPAGIELPNNVTIKLPLFASADPAGFNTGDSGRTWYNSSVQKVRFWDGGAVRSLASEETNNNFSGNNFFSGANSFTGATTFTGAVSTNSISSSSASVTGNINSSATITAPNINATSSLQVGSGAPVYGIQTCTGGAVISASTNIIACSGVTAASICNCQWHGNPTAYSAITYIAPGAGNIAVTFAGIASSGSAAVKCICIKP